MSIEIEIAEDKITDLSEEAREELKTEMEKYSDEIVRESERLEEVIRSGNAPPEITSTIIKQAASKYKNPFGKKEKSKTEIITRIGSIVFMALAGGFFDFQRFANSSIHLALFLAFFLMGVTSTVLSFFPGGGK